MCEKSVLAPNLAHRKLIDLANYVPSSSPRGVGLRFAFCRQILAYFDELYQQIHGCLSLTRYFDGNRKKQSVWVMSTLEHEGRQSIEFHYANYDNLISII